MDYREIIESNDSVIIKGVKNFNIKQILECGQCFRWQRVTDTDYIVVSNRRVIEITQEDDQVIIHNTNMDDFKNIWENYFDLNTDYEDIKEKLSKIDDNVKTSVGYGSGIRILNQDLWETIISFIISANNNIPRIKGIIDRISKKYGTEVNWNGTKYYTFPTAEELSKASVEDLRALGLGFRDVRVYETTKKILNKEVDLNKLAEEKDTEKVREKLLTLPGVGPKVADCILLFSTLKRFEVFPIDVWVRRVMNDLYIKNPDETKVNKREIEKLAKEKYGNLAGLAQQYLFYWKREA